MAASYAVLVVAALLCPPSHAATSKEASTEIAAKVTLEGSLERRLQAVLREALGAQDLLVIVNVALRSETEQADSEILPGVPPPQTSALASDPASLPMVSRISATLIVDQSTPEKDIELAKKISSGILGIMPARGDVVTIEKITFHKPVIPPDPSRYFGLGASALWLSFAAIALALIQRKFLGPLIGNLRDIGAAMLVRNQGAVDAADKEEPSPLITPGPGAPPPAAVESGTNGARKNLPFSFIHEADLPKLSYILRDSDTTATAMVIQYLPAAVASKLLASLPAEKRQSVISRLSRVSELSEKEVRPLEETVRQRIDYLIGGDDKLTDLLESLPFNMQQEMLAALRQSDPPLAERLSRRIILLNDIATLEPAELKLLSRRVPAKVLATVLKSSEALKATVLPKLALGTREWLTQEIELSPELTPEILDAARRPVLAAISQLVREGRIVLRKNGAQAPSPARPPLPNAVNPAPRNS